MSEDKKNTASIGKTLHDARVEKGLTIDDLQNNTKIQKRYLIAIDDDKFDELPGEFYVRAFVKQYADAVGLDGTELLKQFDASLPETQNPEYVDKVSEDKIASRTAQRKVDDRNMTIRRYIPVTIISVAAVLVVLVIWFAAAKSSKNSQQTNISSSSSISVSGSSSSSSDSSSSAKKESKKKTKKTTTNTTKIASESTSTDGGTYKVTTKTAASSIKISTSAKAWVSINANSSNVYQASQDANTNHTVKLPSNTTSATLNLGNATATKLYINGKAVKLTSNSQVQNITFNFSK
ncbi:RodZ domain-containing protein [Lactobacillus sp. Sy-1]|uniref:helix-turn-helix domain-containing protein n=1 Tax=Lactobacillus sp. Sy-1 TaxID=2109645 RepID=UPI001C58C047|nr:RodZ domain-containing protein [Lactobacillus sp. Sy-1]MBW1605798.1 helix-turn-helix domain-containing protein [Lactobacillus sp. Sy-1]